jgi:hypothetical protein
MAELDYSDYPEDSRAPLGAAVSAFMNWAGALMSLALVAGLGWWGYQLMVRDVTGVPVVRALEGPMRIAPDDPGGDLAAHQGLAVNAIAAVGNAEAPPDRVILAPAVPTLSDEDKPMAALLPDEPEEPIAELQAVAVSATDLAVAAALGGDAQVLKVAATADDELEAEMVAEDRAEIADDGIARSPRPAPRPEVRLASIDAGAELAAAALGGIDLDPADIDAGARLVQLGAFPSEEVAREEWDRVASRFEEFFEDKSRVIQRAEAGGRTFYRLRVHGFEDLADSRRFCAVLIAGEASCIPVAWR